MINSYIKYILYFVIIILSTIIIFQLVNDYNKDSKKIVNTETPSSDYDLELNKITFDKEIPKVIYKTHKNLETINNFTKEFEMTKKYTKNFEHKFFTNEDTTNFVKENYNSRIFKAFMNIDDKYGACKADFFRYLLIYKQGGIYLDIKSVVCKELDEIIEKHNDKLIVSYRTNLPFDNSFCYHFFPYGELTQWNIVAPKGHPVLKKIIEEITYNIELESERKEKKFKGGYGVLSLTGPVIFTKLVNENRGKNIKIINKNFDGCFKKCIDGNYRKRYNGGNYWSHNDEIIKNKLISF